MITREAKIVNSLGLHARPAAQLVKLASTFKCEIQIARDELTVNGKSIMGVMMLAAECGSTILFHADGADEGSAVEALAQLVGQGFGEQ